MGTSSSDERVAILRSREIPGECKQYISHHVRNGLVSIMGIARRIQENPDSALKELDVHIHHIADDLKKIGL